VPDEWDDAGVVEGTVELAETFDRCRDELLHVGLDRDVRPYESVRKGHQRRSVISTALPLKSRKSRLADAIVTSI